MTAYVYFADKTMIVAGRCARGRELDSRGESGWMRAHEKVCADCRDWQEMTASGVWRGWIVPGLVIPGDKEVDYETLVRDGVVVYGELRAGEPNHCTADGAASAAGGDGAGAPGKTRADTDRERQPYPIDVRGNGYRRPGVERARAAQLASGDRGRPGAGASGAGAGVGRERLAQGRRRK